MTTADEIRIRALRRYLGDGWTALWEARDDRTRESWESSGYRLVFLAPQLVLRYMELCGWTGEAVERQRRLCT